MPIYTFTDSVGQQTFICRAKVIREAIIKFLTSGRYFSLNRYIADGETQSLEVTLIDGKSTRLYYYNVLDDKILEKGRWV